MEVPATAATVPAVTTEPASATTVEHATIRVPLKVKLSLLITALVVLTVALVGLFLLRQQQQSLTAEMTKRGLTMAENFAAGAKTPLLTGDDLTLGVLVTDAMKDPDVSYVIVADHDGRVLAHSDPRAAVKSEVERPKGLEPLKDRLLVQSYKTPQGRIIDFAVPLVYSGVPVGALYLGFSEEAIVSALASARNQALLITLLMVLAGLRGGAGRPALAADLPPRAGHPGHRGGQLQRGGAGGLARRAGRAHRLLQSHGPQPAREGDDQARVHPLRGPRGGRGDPEEPGADGALRRAARGHRALLRRARLHPALRAHEPGRRGAAAERLLQPDDRDHVQARRHARQVPGRRGDGGLRGPDGPSRPLRSRDPHRHRHAGGHRGPQRAPRPRRQGADRGRHRGERGRGGGGHGGHRGPDGVHRHRRQREPGRPARVQRQARPDPHQPPHLRAGA